MLYKFKSKAAADLIMLEADARRLLKIMLGEPQVKGIVTVQQLPEVTARLQTAVQQEEQRIQAAIEQRRKAVEQGEDASECADEAEPVIRLNVRAQPMLQMLQRCSQEQEDLYWGV
jgi:predicted nucleic acid-binding protein